MAGHIFPPKAREIRKNLKSPKKRKGRIMEAVPVYSINPGSMTNPWEVAAAMNGRGGGCGGWGSDWLALIVLFAIFGGGFGGFGGGWGRGGCGCGGFGGFGNGFADIAVTDATNIAELKAGANFTAQGVNGLRNSLADMNVNLCSQFANLNNSVTTAAYQNQLGQRDLQAQIANCCCTTQQNIASSTNSITQQLCQMNYNSAMLGCEIKQAIAAEGAATRQMIQNQYIAETERKLAEAKQQLFVLEKFGQYANNGGCGNSCNSCGC